MVSVGSQPHAIPTKQWHENSLAFFRFSTQSIVFEIQKYFVNRIYHTFDKKNMFIDRWLGLFAGARCSVGFWPLASYCHESQLKLDGLEICVVSVSRLDLSSRLFSPLSHT